MGNSGSSRTITIDRDYGEVSITQAAYQRILDTQQKPQRRADPERPSLPAGLPPSTSSSSEAGYDHAFGATSGSLGVSREHERFLSQHTERLKQIELESAERLRDAENSFAEAVSSFEAKFKGVPHREICTDTLQRVSECYTTAGSQRVLECAPLVRAYTTCVQRAQQALLAGSAGR